MSKNTEEQNNVYRSMIGKRVCKGHSGKPFKSGLKVNTVSGIIQHPRISCFAFMFLEDDSYVACHICKLAPEEK